jgi:hypothetical protein
VLFPLAPLSVSVFNAERKLMIGFHSIFARSTNPSFFVHLQPVTIIGALLIALAPAKQPVERASTVVL